MSTALPTDGTGQQANPAQGFVERFGINMHVGTINDGYTVAAYNNITTTAGFNSIVGCINYLCCKLIRDTAYSTNQQGIVYWPQIWRATGARYIGVAPGNGGISTAQSSLTLYHDTNAANLGMFVAYEGMNEPDAEGTSIADATTFQQTLFAQAHSDGLLALNWSYGNPGDWGTASNDAAYCDQASVHVYFNPHMRGPDSGGITDYIINNTTGNVPGKPVAVTEWGIETPYANNSNSVSNYAQMVYCLQTIMAYYVRGLPHHAYYAPFDDGSGNWGLFNNDYTPRQSATAIHNLMAVLQDTATGADSLTCGKLNISLGSPWAAASGNGQGCKSTVLQNSNGHFFALLMNEQDVTAEGGADITPPAALSVPVSLGGAATVVNLYDPTVGTAAVQTWSNVSSVTVPVTAYPKILEIVRPGVAMTTLAQLIYADSANNTLKLLGELDASGANFIARHAAQGMTLSLAPGSQTPSPSTPASFTLASSDVTRKYIGILAPSTTIIYINPVGGTAGPGLLGSIPLPANELLEMYITNTVTCYCPLANTQITAFVG